MRVLKSKKGGVKPASRKAAAVPQQQQRRQSPAAVGGNEDRAALARRIRGILGEGSIDSNPSQKDVSSAREHNRVTEL